MDYIKLNAISNSILAFSTFLGVLFAMIYYAYQILNLNILGIFTLVNIYILVNLLFLYIAYGWRLLK